MKISSKYDCRFYSCHLLMLRGTVEIIVSETKPYLIRAKTINIENQIDKLRTTKFTSTDNSKNAASLAPH